MLKRLMLKAAAVVVMGSASLLTARPAQATEARLGCSICEDDSVCSYWTTDQDCEVYCNMPDGGFCELPDGGCWGGSGWNYADEVKCQTITM